MPAIDAASCVDIFVEALAWLKAVCALVGVVAALTSIVLFATYEYVYKHGVSNKEHRDRIANRVEFEKRCMKLRDLAINLTHENVDNVESVLNSLNDPPYGGGSVGFAWANARHALRMYLRKRASKTFAVAGDKELEELSKVLLNYLLEVDRRN